MRTIETLLIIIVVYNNCIIELATVHSISCPSRHSSADYYFSWRIACRHRRARRSPSFFGTLAFWAEVIHLSYL